MIEAVDYIVENMTLKEITKRIQVCEILKKERPEDADYFSQRIELYGIAQGEKEYYDLNGIPSRIWSDKKLAQQVNRLQGQLLYLLEKEKNRSKQRKDKYI